MTIGTYQIIDLVVAMKISLQAKQLALLLLILVLDCVLQANATSYESHSGNLVTTRRQMLRSRVIASPVSKLEEPLGDIFFTPVLPLSPSLQLRRSLRKVKIHSLPPAPKLGSNKRQRVYSPPPPPPRYRPRPPPPPPPPPPCRQPWGFPFFCSPPPPPPPPPPTCPPPPPPTPPPPPPPPMPPTPPPES